MMKRDIPSEPGTIICYGASNTYGYAPTCYGTFRYPEESIWTSVLADRTGWNVMNCGVCGRKIPRNRRQVESVLQLAENGAKTGRPILLWIMLGTNDLLLHKNCRAEDVAQRMEWFLTELMEEDLLRSGRCSLTLIVPPPMGPGEWVTEERLLLESRHLNETYADLVKRLNAFCAPSGPEETKAWPEADCITTGDWNIPLVYDGVHFTEEGHRIFAEHLGRAAGFLQP